MDQVKVKIFESDSCYDIPTDSKGFMGFFQEKIDLIPDEFKESAQIEVEASTFYDSARLGVCVYYFRPKTDSELKADAEKAEKLLEESKRRKMAEFERLKRDLGL